MKSPQLAIFASGAGSNAAKIIEYFKEDEFIKIVVVCTNKKDAPVVELAKENQIPLLIFSKGDFYTTNSVMNYLEAADITHIILAGFLWLIPINMIKKYEKKIINIHPALLPKHGGRGMYGMYVHQAVKASKEKETGITIHLVNENYDEGQYLAQEKVQLTGNESVDEIAKKVQLLEHLYYPEWIKKWINGDL